MANSKTLILGLGNPILSDDGVGLVVAERLKGRVDGVDVIATPLTGLHLLDLLVGYDALFLIDAMITTEMPPGELKFISPDEISLPTLSSHGFNLLEILKAETARREVVAVELHPHHIIIPNALSDSIHDLINDPHPVFETTTIFIRALVAVRGEEATQ